MVSLADLNNGVPSQKPWLTPVALSFTGEVINTDTVVFHQEVGASVVNPPVGSNTLFFDSGSGDLSSKDFGGTVVEYVTSGMIPPLADIVQSDGNTVQSGDLPMYLDGTGTLIGDSNIPVGLLLEVFSGISGVPSLTEPLAPPGQRGLWQVPPGLAFDGGILKYDETDDILYSTDWNRPPLTHEKYSTDGGITWTPIAYDVVPTQAIIFGFNNAGLWVGVPKSIVADHAYTSVNGINFTQGPLLTFTSRSTNVLYNPFSNLFITGIHTSATEWVSTSPDGLVWTPRTTPDFTGLVNLTQFAQSDDGKIVVMVGDSRPNPSYSFDGGVTWFDGTGSAAPTQAVAFQSNLNVFLAGGISRSCSSTDGKVWQDLGVTMPPAVVSIIYVQQYSRWYLDAPDTSNNYSMWSTIDYHLPFIGANLDGSRIIPMSYSHIVYLPSYDRFVLALDNVGDAYSTARPGTIKSTMDSILVRGSAVVATKYAATNEGPIVTNTVTPTTLLGPDFIGSAFFNAPSDEIGMTVNIKASVFVGNINGGDTLTLVLKNNANVITTETIPGPIVNGIYVFDTDITIQTDNTGLISQIMNISGDFPVIQSTGCSWDANGTTLDFVATWSAASPANQVQLNIFIVEVSNQ